MFGFKTISSFNPQIKQIKSHFEYMSVCAQRTVTFSKSASEQVGDKGLMGLREGELPALEMYSGSGTYRTCKHNTAEYLQRLCL